MQVQAVDAGDRHSGREQPRDDQRRELAAAADQDEDVAGRQRPLLRGEERRLLDESRMRSASASAYCRARSVTHAPRPRRHCRPARARTAATVRPGPGARHGARRRGGGRRKRQRFGPERRRSPRRRRRAPAARSGNSRRSTDRETPCAASASESSSALAPEMLARATEPPRIGALEAVDRLLEIADHEQGPRAAARSRSSR